jgi:hypothetical protein
MPILGGTVPGMASITIPETSVRTTSDGTDYSYGVAAIA